MMERLVWKGLVCAIILFFNGHAQNKFFVFNKGQWPSKVQGAYSFNGGDVFFEKNAITFSLYDQKKLHEIYIHGGIGGVQEDHTCTHHDSDACNQDSQIQGHAYQMKFIGANPFAFDITQKEDFQYNFFIGDVRATEMSAGKEILSENLYENIDFRYDVSSHKYDLIVRPSGDVKEITWSYKGLDAVVVRGNELYLKTALGDVVEAMPLVYQMVNGQQIKIKAQFVLKGNKVGIELLEDYDPSLDLIIDPALVFCTYSGSNGLVSADAATYDDAGNMYVSGGTFGFGYPVTTGAYMTDASTFGFTMGIQKFNPTGTQMLYATYLGGTDGSDYPLSMTVAPNGNLYILGTSQSTNYPTSATAYNGNNNGGRDYVLTALNANGNALFGSTYIGGALDDGPFTSSKPSSIIADDNNNIYMAGYTESDNWPITSGVYQTSINGGSDAVLLKINANLSFIQFSTFYGGSGDDFGADLKRDSQGNIFMVGESKSNNLYTPSGNHASFIGGASDGFIAKFNSNGAQVLSASYVGTNALDKIKFIQINQQDEVYVIGSTTGSYVVSSGAYSTPGNIAYFIDRFRNDLGSSIRSTRIGTSGSTWVVNSEFIPTAFGLDGCNKIYFTAAVSGTGFPCTPDAFTSSKKGLYMGVLSPDMSTLEYGSYFGGSTGSHFHQASNNRYNNEGVLFHTECTTADDYPVSTGAPSGGNSNMNDGASFKFTFDFNEYIDPAWSFVPDSITVCDPQVLVQADMHNLQNVDVQWNTGETTTEITVNQNGYYKIQIANDCNLVEDSVYVTIINVQIPQVITTAPNCANADGQIELVFASPMGENLVQWADPMDGDFILENATAGTYNIVIGAGNCNQTISVDLIANTFDLIDSVQTSNINCHQDFGSYELFLNNNIHGNTNITWNGQSATLNELQVPAGTHQLLVVDDWGCEDMVQLDIVDEGDLVVAIDKVNEICRQRDGAINIQILEGVAPYQYFLNGNSANPSNGNLDDGIYEVVVEDANLCRDTQMVQLVDTFFVQGANLMYIPVCENLPASLGIVHPAPFNVINNYSYSISVNGQTFPQANLAYTFPNTGAYQVISEITHPNGCSFTWLDTVVQWADPIADFTSDTILCGGGMINFNNLSQNATVFNWNLGNGQNSNDENPSVNYMGSGQFDVTLVVENVIGCSDQMTKSDWITIHPVVTPQFMVSPKVLDVQEPITLTILNANPNLTYNWSISDGSTYNNAWDPILHSLNAEGNYEVCLEAVTPEQCDAKVCTEIEVKDLWSLFIPNTFTPNGDGDNDYFKIAYENIHSFQIEIYNRWGEMIFQSNDPEFTWDGTVDGQKTQIGTYPYKVYFKDNFDQNHEKSGMVNVVK